jgi:HK97 family phage prohead protease
MQTSERRFIVGAHLRTIKGDKPGISGVAAVYSQNYDTGWFIESIKPGAFTRAITEGQDVRCLFNHNVDNLLARTKSNTLRLEDSEAGLKYDADTDPTTTIGRDVPAMIDRGDIDGCSFSFTVRSDVWRDEYDANGRYVNTYREIEDLDLYDVGPVTFPAYTATSVGVRDANGFRVLGSAAVRQLWPAGVPDELRAHVPILRGKPAPGGRPARRGSEPGLCICPCDECMAGDCENCSHVDCDCADCLCDAAQGRALILRARAHMVAI